MSSITPDPTICQLVAELTNRIGKSLDQLIGRTLTPLDAMSSTCRRQESGLASFTADIIRQYYHVDMTLLCGGTFRSDSIIPPGPVCNQILFFSSLCCSIYYSI